MSGCSLAAGLAAAEQVAEAQQVVTTDHEIDAEQHRGDAERDQRLESESRIDRGGGRLAGQHLLAGLVGRPHAERQHTEENRHVDDDEGTSDENTSELQSLMRISYAVFCLKKKNNKYS